MSDWLFMSPGLAWFAVCACFTAGAIRGFAGFGLSALAMAMLAAFVPPVQLIPVFWFLEMSASLLLMKGGWADADRRMAMTLFVTSSLALPAGLLISLGIDATLSKTIALSVLILFAVAQLAHVRLPLFEARSGAAVTGVTAGLVTGVAGAGGMVIELFTLARDLPARMMRGTLNIYLLGAGFLGLVTHLAVGTMTHEAVTRGLVLTVPTLLGVVLGRALFVPRWERFYKPICLVLLTGLAGASLVRLAAA